MLLVKSLLPSPQVQLNTEESPELLVLKITSEGVQNCVLLAVRLIGSVFLMTTV
jgi:hypothetical protein